MVIKILLSVLVMLLGDDAAAVSVPEVGGKSVRCGGDLQSCGRGWDAVRMQMQHEKENEMRRSLDPEHFKREASPTTSRTSLSAPVELHPPAAKPLHLLTSMLLRSGRESDPGDYKSLPNKPQRFGRSWEGIHKCAECVRGLQNTEAPQGQRINILCWRLLQTLARAKL
ncbi:pro-FMRFamide-related neuropeptide VF [Syngnathoides biaculeatus]|uniref:pro-FMRFamide-related neuropeptide VF n=1 Tax=Syngnathoides biaculeatus TaxID=300417 RepID=UPI002ADDA8A3|nr:pro-FMRFamide-related neuropeptide VF [Syngnathoides biaculeatus]